ncbi:MAG: lysophospholipid acyltransferase family protein [Christensenellales bacterium]
MTNLIDEDTTVPSNTHLTPECHTCKFKITDKYKFIKKGFFFNILSFITYMLAIIVFYPITLIAYGLKVKGRKNLKGIKNAIFVSNHVLTLDFLAITSHIIPTKRPYFLSNHRPFHMPVVRRLVRLLRAVPLPDTPSTTRNFMREIDEAISQGASLLVFPEGAMWNYYNKVRNFMSGAFRFSIKNDVPIVPIVLTYRKPNWFYRMFGRKKPLVTINILPSIKDESSGSIKQKEQELETNTHMIMSEFFKQNSTYNNYISKPVSKILKNKKSQS